MKIVRNGWRLGAIAATLLSASLLTTGAVAASAAQAATSSTYVNGFQVDYGTQAYWIEVSYDGMNVAVADGSADAGARVIQWYNDGGSEQKWYIDSLYSPTGRYLGVALRNENSGLCVDQDLNAGDTVTQEPCENGDGGEIFAQLSDSQGTVFSNAYYGLVLDVSGWSYNAGADIDMWYQNQQPNQTFYLIPTSS